MPHDFAAGFASQLHESPHTPLPLQGRLPDWLQGTLVRNGPAQFEVGTDRYLHWFDGLAMLHAFSINAGSVTYTNRFLRGHSWRQANAEGRIRYQEFATDPCGSRFWRIVSRFFRKPTDNCCVNVSRLANRFVALTETPLAIEFDSQSLETLGDFRFHDSLKGQLTTAHPHYDGARRESINYLTCFGRKNAYNIYRLPDGSATRQRLCRYEVREPAYMHSFGMTPRYVVLAEFPLRVSPWRLLFSGRPFIENFRWTAEDPTRFLVFERDSGKLRGIWETEAFMAFHHVNAWERGDEVVLDLCTYPDASVIHDLYLDELREPTHPAPQPEFRRYVLEADGTTRWERLGDDSLELPRIHYSRVNGQEYRYAYGVGLTPDVPSTAASRLVKLDTHDGTSTIWSEPHCYPGEGVFIPRPDATAEDAGLVLSVVLDGTQGTSFLLVLDGETFQEQARAVVPQHIPFGFHGQFFRG